MQYGKHGGGGTVVEMSTDVLVRKDADAGGQPGALAALAAGFAGSAEAPVGAWPGSVSGAGAAPSRMRGDLMGFVKNEMRAPLLGLQALRESLAGSPCSPELTERMERQVRVLTRRVELLLEDLALVSTYDRRTLALELTTLDLDAELATFATDVPDLVIHRAGDAGLRLSADRLRLEQICANLVRNVQRRGGWQVTIRLSAGPNYVTFRVDDPGPRDAHELAIIKLLVQAHGGMTGHEPDGAFTFTLPRHAS